MSNHRAYAEGAAKQGLDKMLGEELRPEHNVVCERSHMKAPENEKQKGRKRKGGKFEDVSFTIEEEQD